MIKFEHLNKSLEKTIAQREDELKSKINYLISNLEDALVRIREHSFVHSAGVVHAVGTDIDVLVREICVLRQLQENASNLTICNKDS